MRTGGDSNRDFRCRHWRAVIRITALARHIWRIGLRWHDRVIHAGSAIRADHADCLADLPACFLRGVYILSGCLGSVVHRVRRIAFKTAR